MNRSKRLNLGAARWAAVAETSPAVRSPDDPVPAFGRRISRKDAETLTLLIYADAGRTELLESVDLPFDPHTSEGELFSKSLSGAKLTLRCTLR